MSQPEHYVSRLTLAPAVGKLSHQNEFKETSIKVTVCESRPDSYGTTVEDDKCLILVRAGNTPSVEGGGMYVADNTNMQTTVLILTLLTIYVSR